uniref:Proprotein convertase subtilisin/kexin type 4 n=1 Tax=Anas platyrhynchos TaxID=8839 RepID=A0A8B9SWM0_ANAPL
TLTPSPAARSKPPHSSFLGPQVLEGEPYYHFRHRGTRQKSLSRHWGWNLRLSREPKVLWFEQQTAKRRAKRSGSVVPTDPWFPKQWYMNNDINPDLNVLAAWSKGYTGLGVVLSILDDGIEKDHPDLSANYDPLASYDFNSNDPDPQPRYNAWDENRHGTRCAGEVAAVANNQICGAGVAYNAKIGGVRMLDGPIMDIVEAQSLGLRPQHIHIYSASWGPTDDGRTVDGPGVLAAEAFYRGVTKGRGGLGSIFIWASGNGGTNYDNCNCDGYANSIYTLAVGSVLASGQRPWYSEACSSTLTTTYSSSTRSELQIVTTDLRHRCTAKHAGTSASAPLAAGMVALALEANPALSWRDVQHLVVRASKPAHLQAEDWAVNGVGRKVSHHYGYGLLDAGLLVELAKAWAGTRPQRRCSLRALRAPRNIGSKLTVSVDASSCSGRTKRIRSLEHVQVQLSLSYSRRGDLVLALSSPMGTTSTLVTVRPYDTSQQGGPPGMAPSHQCHPVPCCPPSVVSTWLVSSSPRGRIWPEALCRATFPRGLRLSLHSLEENIFFPGSSSPTPTALHTPNPEGASRVCSSCHPSCYTCRGASANDCTACPPARVFHELSHSCPPLLGFSPEDGQHGDLLPVLLVCGVLILSAILCATYRKVVQGGWPYR